MFIQKCQLTTEQKEALYKHATISSLNQLSQVIKLWIPAKKPLLVSWSQKVSGIVWTKNVFFLQATRTHGNRLTRFATMNYQITTLNMGNASTSCARFYKRISDLCLMRKNVVVAHSWIKCVVVALQPILFIEHYTFQQLYFLHGSICLRKFLFYLHKLRKHGKQKYTKIHSHN